MTSRAQTTLDFAIGTGVFLVVVLFVFMLLPTLFAPFTTGDTAGTVVADRGATTLSERVLGPADRRAVLNETCTVAFFDGGGIPAGCDFSSHDLHAVLGVDEVRGLNATIERDGTVVTHDGVRLATGPTPPSVSTDVSVAVRVVLLDGQRAILYLRAW